MHHVPVAIFDCFGAEIISEIKPIILRKARDGRRGQHMALMNCAGKRLVLPNMKIINPGGIQTGGIPPYEETRRYVERGKIVYQSISHAGLFWTNGGGAFERSAHEVAESATALDDHSKEESFYSSESGRKQSTQPPVKSANSKDTARSIYVD